MSHKRSKQSKIEPVVALCYIRLSWNREGKDTESPERQRANIVRVCEQYGWAPEFYEDTDGHRSGTTEKNRPGWLALKARLGDADIAALVANDMSRLHRKGWRVGDLLDFVDEHEVKLVLAAQGKQIDLSTPLGRLMIQMSAIFDEWYAQDIGQRSRDSIQHRKSKGKTVGIPPFGSTRDKDGFLVPTDEGAWMLQDGTFLRGNSRQPPEPGAIWRGYHAAAFRVLELYSAGRIGARKLAKNMQREGWTYRNRKGDPIPFEADDIRRIVANWPEYGGNISTVRAKERHPYRYPFENYKLEPARAIFPLELLYQVGRVRYVRTRARAIDYGHQSRIHPYPLLGLVYCHHCDLRAEQQNDPSQRTRLGGKDKGAPGRYRHQQSVRCECKNRSIKREIVEAEIGRLIERIVPRSELDTTTLSVDSVVGSYSQLEYDTRAAETRISIARCKRRIEAARHLLEDGDIDYAEFIYRKAINEQEIASFGSRLADEKEVVVRLEMWIDLFAQIEYVWKSAGDEDRQALARSLFQEVVVDLDTQIVTRVKMQSWAKLLVLTQDQ